MIPEERPQFDKRLGRFLKKGSLLYRICTVTNFDFNEISENKAEFPDNNRQNIYHTRFHPPEHMKTTVAANNMIDDDLQDINLRSPVIMPRDFTKDWLEEKRKAKRRSSKQFSDDDEFEMALEEEEAKLKGTDKKAKDAVSENQVLSPTGEELSNSEHSSDQTSDQTLNTQSPSDTNDEESESLDEQEERRIKELTSSTESIPSNDPMDSLMHLKESSVDHKNFFSIKDEDKTDGPKDSSLDHSQGNEVASHFEDAFEKGFEKGFEEAKDHAQKDFKNKVDALNELLKNVEEKKKEMVKGTKNQIEHLVRSMTEAILNKKIKSDVSVLTDLISRAVDEGIKDDDYKIFVSPKVFEEISRSDQNVSFDKSKIISDSKLEQYDFKIENDQKVVESGISKIVDHLVEQLDLNFLDEKAET